MVPDDQSLAACYDHPPHAVGIALWNTTVWSIMNSTLQLICLGAVCLSRLHCARVLFSKSASSRWASRYAATESSCTLHYVHSQQAAFCTCDILMSKLDSLCSIFADRLFRNFTLNVRRPLKYAKCGDVLHTRRWHFPCDVIRHS